MVGVGWWHAGCKSLGMRPDRLTTTAQQALADAQTDAASRGNPEVTGLHILRALLEDKNGPGVSIMNSPPRRFPIRNR